MYSLSPENSPAFSRETGLFVFSKNLRQYRWCSSHRDGPRPFTEPVHVHLKYDNPAGLLSHLLNLRKALLVLEILGFLSVHLKGKYIDAFFLFFFAVDAVNGYLISNQMKISVYFIDSKQMIIELLSFQYINIKHLILIILREMHQNKSQDKHQIPK